MKKVIPFVIAALAGISLSSFTTSEKTELVYYFDGVWKSTMLTPCPEVDETDCVLPIPAEQYEEFPIFKEENGEHYRRAN